MRNPLKKPPRIPLVIGQTLAELLGTVMLLFLLITANISTRKLQLELSASSSESAAPVFAQTSQLIGWANTFCIVWLCLLVSLSHGTGFLNPLIPMSLAIAGRYPWRHVALMLPVIYVAAWIGTAAAFLFNQPRLMALNTAAMRASGGNASMSNLSAGADTFAAGGGAEAHFANTVIDVFTTRPHTVASPLYCLVEHALSCTALVSLVLLLVDARSKLRPPFCAWHGLIALLVTAICAQFSTYSPATVNPAIELSVRVFLAVCLRTRQPFSYGRHHWLSAVIGQHVGAVLGLLVYCVVFARGSAEMQRDRREERGRLQTDKKEARQLQVDKEEEAGPHDEKQQDFEMKSPPNKANDETHLESQMLI